MRTITLGLCLFLFNACSWKLKDFFHRDKKAKDVSELEVDKEVEDKFVISEKTKEEQEEVKSLPIEENQPEVSQETEAAPTQKTEKKIIVAKEESTQKQEEKAATQEPSSLFLTDTYPEGYPEKFKEYDTESKKIWEKFSPRVFPGESQFVEITYMGINVGKVFIKNQGESSIGNRPAYHFHARMKTAPFYRYIYELDDTLDSYVDKESFLPVKYRLYQNESKKVIEDNQLFDRENLKMYFRYSRIKNGKTDKKNKDLFIPRYSQDAFSIYYFMRGLPLKAGEVYKFPVVTREKIWFLTVSSKGRELVKTPLGKKACLKLEAKTEYEGDLAKKGTMSIWLSDDDRRNLVAFEAEVKIGAVKGMISEYNP